MEKTCNTCRFFNNCNECVKFSIKVNENYGACGDYAQKCTINETANQKMKLYD